MQLQIKIPIGWVGSVPLENNQFFNAFLDRSQCGIFDKAEVPIAGISQESIRNSQIRRIEVRK